MTGFAFIFIAWLWLLAGFVLGARWAGRARDDQDELCEVIDRAIADAGAKQATGGRFATWDRERMN